MFRGGGDGLHRARRRIGNNAFIQFVEQLERDEDMALDTFVVGKDKLTITTIMPDPAKMDRRTSTELPPSSARFLSRQGIPWPEEIAAPGLMAMSCPGTAAGKADRCCCQDLPLRGFTTSFSWRKLIERDYTARSPDFAEIIAYYAKSANRPGCQTAIAIRALVPKVRLSWSSALSGPRSTSMSRRVIQAINSNRRPICHSQTFLTALRPLVVEELEPHS